MLEDDGTMLKVNGVPSWTFALEFAWSSESDRLEAPAARAPISTMALSATIVSVRRIRPLNNRENEICMCFGPFSFPFLKTTHTFVCGYQPAAMRAFDASDECGL